MKKKIVVDAFFGFLVGAIVCYLIPVFSLMGIKLAGLADDPFTEVSNIIANTGLHINYASIAEFMVFGALIGAVVMVCYGLLRDKLLK